MSVSWTCGGVTALPGGGASRAFPLPPRPRLRGASQPAGCAAVGAPSPRAGGGRRQVLPGGSRGSDATPALQLCAHGRSLWTQRREGAAAPSLCPVPSAFPCCWSVPVCVLWLLGLVAGFFPWVGLLWKVWEALLTPRPRFLPGCSLGLHVTWSCEHAPSPGCGRWFFHAPPRPQATSWIDGATFLHLLSPSATLHIPSGPPGRLVVLSGPLSTTNGSSGPVCCC